MKILIWSWSFSCYVPASTGWVWRVQCVPNLSQLPMGRITPWSLKFNISSSTWCRLTPPPTLWNHIILMRMQMKGERVGNHASWVACQKCFPGEGWLSPASSAAAVFAGGLALGGTWPSLKETHLHWCAHCCLFLFMVFKQLMQVLTALPCLNLCESFYFGELSEDPWSWGQRRKAG